MNKFETARNRMVDRQLERRGIGSAEVLDAMRTVPREAFVAPASAKFAYEDSPLPIGEGQTISQPYIVALMVEAAELKSSDRVLEVGAGSGYAAAVMSRIAASVHAVEHYASLADAGKLRSAELGYRNIEWHCDDGSKGWPEAAPFDAIVVSACGPEVPDALRDQLVIGGRLIIPVGSDEGRQNLLKIVRHGETDFEQESLGGVQFVPLIGAHGWAENGT
jgi:protein-L-isoaspartate(D-aspartate) O-methyltransferase